MQHFSYFHHFHELHFLGGILYCLEPLLSYQAIGGSKDGVHGEDHCQDEHGEQPSKSDILSPPFAVLVIIMIRRRIHGVVLSRQLVLVYE